MSTGEINLSEPVTGEADRDNEFSHIREALRGLKFGSVNISIQDGVVVQIDRTEKRRVRRTDAK
jgi:hypothetical protein